MSEPDLFGDNPPRLALVPPPREKHPALQRARALCIRLKRTRAPDERKRIVHLICENLKAMCKPRGGVR